MKKEETVGFMIKTLDKMIMRSQITSIRKAGHEKLPHMHGWIIGYLYENREKEICQKDLEAEFSIARSTVTNIVKQMEKNGYIIRIGVERDSRLKQLKLTQKGEECHKAVVDSFRRIEESICQGIVPEDLEIFLRVAGQIRQNLMKDQDGMPCFPECIPPSE